MALPHFTLSELLSAGVHFGHRDFRWNPKLKHHIFGTRNGIHIIDLQQTAPLMLNALMAVESTVAKGGRVLFVGTKPQAQQLVAEAAERCGMYFINHRWLGGLLTNWKTISQSIRRLKELEEHFTQSEAAQVKLAELQAAATPEAPVAKSAVMDPMAHLTKKERLMRTRERTNLRRVLGGIMNMAGLPDLIVVLSVHQDKIAVDEAARLGIPVVGIVDTNADSTGVTHIVPGNDDSTRALGLYARLFADAVLSGIAQQASQVQPMAATDAPRAPRTAKGPTTVTLSKKAQEVASADEATPAASA